MTVKLENEKSVTRIINLSGIGELQIIVTNSTITFKRGRRECNLDMQEALKHAKPPITALAKAHGGINSKKSWLKDGKKSE